MLVVVAVMLGVPVPVVQVVQVIVVGDGAVAAPVAVDVVVLGGVVRPMPRVLIMGSLSPGESVDEAGSGAWLGSTACPGVGTDRTGDNDAWARARGRSTASPNRITAGGSGGRRHPPGGRVRPVRSARVQPSPLLHGRDSVAVGADAFTR